MIKLYNEDCLIGMKGIPDNSIDLIVTDPPYKIITGGDKDGIHSRRPSGMLSGNRELFQGQDIEHSSWMREVYRIAKEETHCYIFSNALNIRSMLNISIDVGFKLHNLLVWEKNNCTPSQYYMKNAEYVLFLRKGRAKYIHNIGESKTVHKFKNIIGKKVHPTQKPVELLEFYIINSSNAGDLVLDPFMGSGTTGVACANIGRDFVGFELENSYFDTANKRIQRSIENNGSR